MSYSLEVKVRDLPPENKRPHLVLLGAGASYAALPNGDRNGKKMPLMMNFVETIGMEAIADNTGIPWRGRNFEEFYSDLHADTSKSKERDQVERYIFQYFSRLELPDQPTIYDYLILSLREKDIIATFNWDPFLYWAFMRNANVVDPPIFLFLHGNTAVSYRFDPDGMPRSSPISPTQGTLPDGLHRAPLLYPVRMKNYQSDPMTRLYWEMMAQAMKHAFVFTVFGYGAPTSDAEAVKLLKGGWGNVNQRAYEEVEVIDRPGLDEEVLRARWDKFIHTHHYQVHGSFFESIIAKMPRRSIEGMWAQLMAAQFVEANPVPPLGTMSLTELQDWYRPLILAEHAFKPTGKNAP